MNNQIFCGWIRDIFIPVSGTASYQQGIRTFRLQRPPAAVDGDRCEYNAPRARGILPQEKNHTTQIDASTVD